MWGKKQKKEKIKKKIISRFQEHKYVLRRQAKACKVSEAFA